MTDTTEKPCAAPPMGLLQVLLHFYRNMEAANRVPPPLHVLVHEKDSTKDEGSVIAFDSDRAVLNPVIGRLPVGTRFRVLYVAPDQVRTIRPPKADPEPETVDTGGSVDAGTTPQDKGADVIVSAPRARVRSR